MIERRFRLRGPFLEIFKRREPEVLLAGAAGTGKSTAALIYVHMMALKYPGMRALFARKTLQSLTASTLVTYENYVANEALATGLVTFFGGNAREVQSYRYSNGSRIVVGGLDNPERVKSTEYDIVFVDEATELREDDWQTLSSRLRNGVMPYQQLLAACNPAHPDHWLKRRCDQGNTLLMNTRHEDNPAYYDDLGRLTDDGAAYIKRLDGLTGLAHKRLRQGLWASADGIIYDTFEPARHVVPTFDIPKDWPRYWTIDFGFDNPFVWQSWAEDPDGVLYLYREWYASNVTTPEHARKIRETVISNGEWVEPRPYTIICDHDAGDRAILERELGLGTSPAKKDVVEGIQAVAQRFATDRLKIVDGYQMHRDTRMAEQHKPTSVTEELPAYVWDQSKQADAKDRPVKKNDHGADALRYMVAEKDLRPRFRMRWIK